VTRAVANISRRPPTTSAGTTWTIETWSCELCGEAGPDRDDRPLSDCPETASGAHRVTWAPESHAAAVALRVPALRPATHTEHAAELALLDRGAA
jgi:hypothetical protein